MAKAFIDTSTPFEPWCFQLSNGASGHEMHFVKLFCARHGLEPRIETIEQTWFYSPEAREMYDSAHCSEAIMLAHAKLMSIAWREGFTPLLGSGDVLLAREKLGWYLRKQEMMAFWANYAAKNGEPPPDFFHVPELALSMLLEPEVQTLVRGPSLLINNRPTKTKVYKKYWPDLELRQKYHGGENVGALLVRLSAWGDHGRARTWLLPYDDAVNQLSPLVC